MNGFVCNLINHSETPLIVQRWYSAISLVNMQTGVEADSIHLSSLDSEQHNARYRVAARIDTWQTNNEECYTVKRTPSCHCAASA
jgi:hypothetical protein